MKNSNIPWLGEIPDDWGTTKLKYIGKAIIGLTYSPDEVSEKGKIVLRSANVQNGKIILEDNVYVEKEISEKLLLRKGDILICSRNGSKHLIGKNALIDTDSEGNTFGAFMTVFRTENYRFLYYVLNSSIFDYYLSSFLTATINQLITSNLNNIIIALPPLPTQTAIADFLDKKCAEIDVTIEKTKATIEKYKKLKQSIITEAVTKGLKQDVPMRDSGIEWIGQIPEDWEVNKLSRISEIGSGTTPKANSKYYDGNMYWLNTGDLNDKIITKLPKTITEKALEDYSALRIYSKNSIVIAMYGATIGKLGILDFEATTNQACCVITCNKSMEYKFIFYALFVGRKYILSLSVGSGQPNINQDTIKQFKIPIPSLEEQQEIVDFLDKKTATIDDIIAKKEALFEKLTGYKKSLIYEAVTGKMEV